MTAGRQVGGRASVCAGASWSLHVGPVLTCGLRMDLGEATALPTRLSPQYPSDLPTYTAPARWSGEGGSPLLEPDLTVGPVARRFSGSCLFQAVMYARCTYLLVLCTLPQFDSYGLLYGVQGLDPPPPPPSPAPFPPPG